MVKSRPSIFLNGWLGFREQITIEHYSNLIYKSDSDPTGLLSAISDSTRASFKISINPIYSRQALTHYITTNKD